MSSSAPARRAARLIAGAALVAGACVWTPPARAQLYARFAVADSALGAALKTSGAQFEPAWNALLVAELRATIARADSAARLLALERRVAAAEPAALGTTVGRAALALRARWTPAQRRARVAAAVAESLAAVVAAARDFGRADSLLAWAVAGYQAIGEGRRVAWVYGARAAIAFSREDWPRADSLYRSALEARRAIGDLRMVGNALNMLGAVGLRTRRYDDAWRFAGEARRVREQTGETAALGATLGILALIAAAEGRADTAEVYYRAALTLTVAQGDSARASDVLINYAQFLAHGSDPARADPLLERALVIAREQHDPSSQAYIVAALGDRLRQGGHYAEALERLETARALALAARNVPALRMALINIGHTEIDLGDGAAARPPLERGLALAESLTDRFDQSGALTNLSIAATLEGDPGAAERFARRALDAALAAGDSSRVDAVAATLGSMAVDRGDFATAESWFERAAAAGRGEESRATDLHNLGVVRALTGRLDDAERDFEEELAIASRIGYRGAEWNALLSLGDVAERRGQIAAALAFDRRAATTIEGLRADQGAERPSVRLLARRLFAFEALIHLLTRLEPAHPESAWAAEAFQWSERARARAFLDLVAAAGGEAQRVQPLTLAAAQGLLRPRHEAMLVYSVGDSSTSLWVLTPRAWKHFALPPRKALRTRVELLRRGLADPATADAKSTHAASRALFTTLVAPALPMLEGVDHVIVAPDGLLALVPFEALLTRDVDRDGAAPKGAYLVERWAVSYTPSATALATRVGAAAGAAGADANAGGIVAVGDPALAPDSTVGAATADGSAPARPALAPLPNTLAEVALLRALAAKRPITTLTGRDATRERWLALAELPRAALIHVATHGEANEIEPERSGLWFAAQGSAPGFVSVGDILGLKLRASLVTLSACETGLGRLEDGEGVIGLTRAFLAAGSRSVMVSLWKVNDRSTALLMERFYRGLLAGGAPGATALAEAKRALLANAETRSPFYWAPFVIVGSAGKLAE
ncbi:MAG: CHAT domain-containing protein [Candidatus Eisenbacteria bacterium]|nr:CHAT domain-containing protein [Candidatus Eisenbacteria bacterium]